MYEEERRFSWTNLFIKIIVAIIIILFIVWLLSLTNKKVSNKLDIITDNIFSENVEKLKTAGKEYFTTDRLPKKVGQIEKVTLEKLYNEKILLSLKDKKGNYCLSKKSYVSVEKMEKEYKMRVYLDCGDDKDYIIFPLEEKKECTINTCDKEKEDTTENKNSSVNNNTSNSTNTTNNNITTNNTTKNNTNTSKASNNNTSSNTTNNNNTNSNIAYEDTAASYVTTINDFRCDKKTRTWVFIKSCQSPSVSNAKCSVSGEKDVLLSNLTNGAYCTTSKPGTNSSNSGKTSNTTKPSNTNSNTGSNSSKNTSAPYVKTINDYRCNKATKSWIYIKSCQSSSVSNAKCSVSGEKDVLLSNLTNGAYCTTSKPGTNSSNSGKTSNTTKPSNTNSNTGSNSNTDKTNNDSSNVTKQQYNYSKVIGGYWTDWSDWSKWSTTYVSKTDYVDVETRKKTVLDYNKFAGNAHCPKAKTGYKLSVDDDTCIYTKTVITDTSDLICDDNDERVKDAIFINRNVLTCRYKKKVTSNTKYTLSTNYVTSSGYKVPSDNSIYKYVRVNSYVDSTGKTKYVFRRYEKKYDIEYKTIPIPAICPRGMELDDNYDRCVKKSVKEYTESKKCAKDQIEKNGRCYIFVNKTITEYRYRTRKYIEKEIVNATSNIKNDKELLTAGYKLEVK